MTILSPFLGLYDRISKLAYWNGFDSIINETKKLKIMFDELFKDTFNYFQFHETTDKGASIYIAVPGYEKEDLSVELSGNALQIKPKEKLTEDDKFYKIKKSFGPIEYKLSPSFKVKSIDAKLVNGILSIDLNKDESSDITVDIK